MTRAFNDPPPATSALEDKQFRANIALICTLTLGVIIGFCGMEFVASTGAISAFNECYNNQGTLEACKRIPPAAEG